MTTQEILNEKIKMESMGWTYEKTDKNGTRYYTTCKCPKCNGRGYLDYYNHVEGGICFKCNGIGYTEKIRTTKIMTPEYETKLNAKRTEKKMAKAADENKRMLNKDNFNENGTTFCVLGDTYKIKDELKAMGAKYNNILGWHSPKEMNKYPTIEISADDFYKTDVYGRYYVGGMFSQAVDKIQKANDALKRNENTSRYIGEIGDKVEMLVTLKRTSTFVSHFTYEGEMNFVYNFVDKDGNILVWKTTKDLDIAEGTEITIKGTIKSHDEYKGVEQTKLVRCKII